VVTAEWPPAFFSEGEERDLAMRGGVSHLESFDLPSWTVSPEIHR
jgi:hypothetical protein